MTSAAEWFLQLFHRLESAAIWFWNSLFYVLWRGILELLDRLGIYGLFWKPFYLFLAYMHTSGAAKLKFMNYGYCPISDEDDADLKVVQKEIESVGEDEKNNVQLYARALTLCPLFPKELAGLKLLEVSCGHGGGVEWLSEQFPQLAEVRGMDQAIVDTLGGKIFRGNAKNMPIGDNSVDILLNIESSHGYDFQPLFFSECCRILKPGGYLVWADLRPNGFIADVCFEDAETAGLRMKKRMDITQNVLKSLDVQHKRIRPLFQAQWYTRITRLFWDCFWGVPGTALYRALKDGRWTYYAVLWQRPLFNQEQ